MKKANRTVLPIEQLKVGGVGGKSGWQGVFVEQHKMLGKAWERLGTLEGKTPGICHVSSAICSHSEDCLGF